MARACRLAEALHMPLEERSEVLVLSRTTLKDWNIHALAWLGILGLMTTMFWPILNGSRPLFRGASATSEDSGVTPFQAATDSYNAGDFAQAEKHFEEAARRHPNEARVFNMLAYARIEQDKKDAALAAAKEAVRLAPMSGYIVDTLAEMHERRGELTDAAREYERALTCMGDEDSSKTIVKYGRTLMKLGRFEEGVGQLTTALRGRNKEWAAAAARILDRRVMRAPLSP